MILEALAATALVLAAIPAVMTALNLRRYLPPLPVRDRSPLPRVSILIPARNEERSIQAAVESALASKGVDLELIVLDDQSEDATAAIVQGLAAVDPRVRLVSAPPLPAGWCGKQHACWVLAREAAHDLLVFLDADVRLAPNGVARLVLFLEESGADLVSGIPLQETETFLERLLIPLIHFVLLGFLPMRGMRQSRSPAYAAGCGQLFLARRSGYDRAGGHAAIRTTLHDGIKLPRAFRAAGLHTDLCDATELARCRMYRSGPEVWRGLAKNATEGLGAPGVIGPMTLLLAGGQVLPLALLAAAPWLTPPALCMALAATLLSYLPRVQAMARFRQPLVSVLLHPLGVLVLLGIQWYALAAQLAGKPRGWRGRAYNAGASA